MLGCVPVEYGQTGVAGRVVVELMWFHVHLEAAVKIFIHDMLHVSIRWLKLMGLHTSGV